MKGIYKITNLKNDKVYIGESIDIYQRWGRHKKDLRKGEHDNTYLQNSWNKYGEKYFYFEVLEEMSYTSDKKALKLKELFYIKTFKSYTKENGYNIMVDTETMINSINENTNFKLKKVCQYTKEGIFIKKWSCAREVCENLGFISLDRFQSKVNNIHYYKGYCWFYEDEEFIPIKKFKLNHLSKKPIYEFCPSSGDLLHIWDDIFLLLSDLGLTRKQFYKVPLKYHKLKTGRLFTYNKDFNFLEWKLAKNNFTRNKTYKQKKFINFKTGEIIYHHSIKEVAEQLGISYWCFAKEINLGFIYKDWGFDYCTEKPKMPRINKALKNVDVKNVSTGEVFNFSSIKKFITFAKISHTRFSIAKRNKSFPFTYGEWEILNISS